MSIKTKILLPTVALTILVATAILTSNITLFSQFVDKAALDRVGVASNAVLNDLEILKVEADNAASSIAENPDVIKAIAGKNRDELRNLIGYLQERVDKGFCTITDTEGKVIFRTHALDSYGDSVASQAHVGSAMTGKSLTAIEAETIARLAVCSGYPVFDDQGAIVGVVSAGFRLDTDEFVDSFKQLLGCEMGVLLGSQRIATTIRQQDGTRAVNTPVDPHVSDVVLKGDTFAGRADMLGRHALARYAPLFGPDDKVVGMVFVGQYVDATAETVRAFVRSGLILTLPILAIFTTLILWVAHRIVVPIHAMTRAASALASGDTDIDIRVNTKDEMRFLADAFNDMIENTRQQVQMIEQIAQGNSSASVAASLKMRSENDVMNRALEKLHTTIQAQADAIREEHNRVRLMLDATPLAIRLWNRDIRLIACNDAAVKLFGLKDKQEYLKRYFELTPEYQPNGQKSSDRVMSMVAETFEKGIGVYHYEYLFPDGTLIPSEITMVRVPYGDDYVVASYSRDLREQQKMLAEIERRDHLLQTVNQMAETLLRSDPDDFSETLHRCMGTMARAIEADRMCFFKNHTINGKLHHTQMCEWSDRVRSFQGADVRTDVSYDAKTPTLKEVLSRGECLHRLVRDLPPTDREWIGEQGTLAFLTVPIFVQGEFWGFIGFDNCHDERLFGEETIVRSGSLLIASALLRNDYLLSIKETSARLEVALTNAQEAVIAKRQFLAHMSHEIRTPLNAVIGLSELALGEECLSRETESNLEKIYSAGSTILSIINDILDISKIEAGKFEISPVQYDVPSLINDTVVLNNVRVGERDLAFKLDVDADLPSVLYGDDLRIKQIFNNLLSNAFKYTYFGVVKWRVSFERDGNDVWLVSSVRDTGIGIKQEDVQHLFADYHQVDSKTNRQVEGTGLGLAIVKRLVELMDGTISVESEYGKGSTFRVRLRQTLVSDTPIGKEVAENLMAMRYALSKRTANSKQARIDLSYAHILVVDDVETNLDIVKGIMKSYGVKVDCATSGLQAVEMIRSGVPRYDAVFMDHMMPGMDGMEATRIIREVIGTDYARNIPIIALTANAIVGNEEIFLSRGFQAFITKPIDMMKLDSVLRRWVRDKQREQELSADEQDQTDEHNEELTDPRPSPPASKPSLLANITIRSLDQERCLDRLGGDETVFIDVLRSYAVNTPSLLVKLRMFLAADNLEDYGIIVHGLKGSSYGICAQEAGQAAESLEREAKSGNLDAVKAGHAVFEAIAGPLLAEIKKALETIDAAVDKPLADEPDPVLLEELRQACAAFDMDRVDETMSRLEAFRYERGGGLVSWLRDRVSEMTFEKISSGAWPTE